MYTVISDKAFEWILADIAGFGDRPGELFPDLLEIDIAEVSRELNQAIEIHVTQSYWDKQEKLSIAL